MNDETNAPEHVPGETPAPADGVVKKFGKGLLWVFDKGSEYVSQYPRTALAVIITLLAIRIFV